MIDDKQLRAARALLDWSQEKLAAESKIARATIKNIENRSTLPRLETARQLHETLEKAGVEFTPNSGVRLKDRIVDTHEGSDATRLLVEDIYETLKGTGGEILIAFVNEEQGLKDLGADFLREQFRKRKEANITHRLLIHPEEKFVYPPLEMYRIVPREYFAAHPFFIYGPKLALLCSAPTQRFVILKDERFAESARKLFDFIWDRTEMPTSKMIRKEPL